jgi:hypothetical protein
LLHLWNAAILIASASVALAADRLAAAPARPFSRVAPAGSVADIGSFISPVQPAGDGSRFAWSLDFDPFDREGAATAQFDVASVPSGPTVPTTTARSRLTAILIADDRAIAVIDEVTVSVGDVLRDGARVASIKPDRVSIVEKSGRWRTLTLPNRGH